MIKIRVNITLSNSDYSYWQYGEPGKNEGWIFKQNIIYIFKKFRNDQAAYSKSAKRGISTFICLIIV